MMLALLLSPPLAALRRLASRKVVPGDDDEDVDDGAGTEDGGDGAGRGEDDGGNWGGGAEGRGMRRQRMVDCPRRIPSWSQSEIIFSTFSHLMFPFPVFTESDQHIPISHAAGPIAESRKRDPAGPIAESWNRIPAGPIAESIRFPKLKDEAHPSSPRVTARVSSVVARSEFSVGTELTPGGEVSPSPTPWGDAKAGVEVSAPSATSSVPPPPPPPPRRRKKPLKKGIFSSHGLLKRGYRRPGAGKKVRGTGSVHVRLARMKDHSLKSNASTHKYVHTYAAGAVQQRS